MKPAALEATALACERGNRLLFRDLELRAGAGEALQVRGPNGSGKTSLLRILCGLSEPTWGEVRWRGQRLRPGDQDGLASLLYVGHADGLKRELSPLENLDAHRRIRGGGRLRSIEALRRLDLESHAQLPVSSLSAGQRRRAALARLLTSEAALWILDEPLNALDDTGIELVQGLLAEHLDAAGTIVLTSHLPVAAPGHAIAELTLG